MTATWSLGGVSLYVIKDSGDEVRPRIDYINPLTTAQTTFIRQHGRDSDKREIQAYMISNYSSLAALIDGTAQSLISPWGSEGTYVIIDTKSERIQDFDQCDARLTVKVTIDLIKVT